MGLSDTSSVRFPFNYRGPSHNTVCKPKAAKRKARVAKGLVDSQARGPLGQAGPSDDGAVVKAERDGVAAAHHRVEPVAVKVASPSVTAGCECFVQCHIFSARIRHNNGLLVLSSVFFVFREGAEGG